jgi:hypothetical protein
MAERNIVGGMFGISPETYLMNRDLAGQQQAATLAAGPGTMMNPSLAPFYAQAAQQGQLIGRGVGGLLGVEDPELAKIRDVQQMRTQFDVSTPTGLRSFAQALGQRGYTDLAMQAASRAADIDKELSQAEKNRQEKLPAIANLQLYRENLIKLVGKDDTRVKEVNAAIEAAGRGQGNVVNIDQKGQTAFEQGLGAKDADRVTNAEKLIESAAGTLGTLKKMAEVNQMGVIGGTGSAARIEALKFLDTAGFTTPKEKTRLASSENFNKLTGDLILERIKQLGTNPSNADRDFIAKIVPQLESSALARKQLIEYMADKANQVVNEATKLSTYGRTYSGLKGYKPTIPLVDATLPTKNISQYSVQELENMLKNAKPAGAK